LTERNLQYKDQYKGLPIKTIDCSILFLILVQEQLLKVKLKKCASAGFQAFDSFISSLEDEI